MHACVQCGSPVGRRLVSCCGRLAVVTCDVISYEEKVMGNTILKNNIILHKLKILQWAA